jgi:hypothetical protein
MAMSKKDMGRKSAKKKAQLEELEKTGCFRKW